MATWGTGGGLGRPKSSGGGGRVLPTPDEIFFWIPSLSFGHKNILRVVMRVIFDITLLSPHPIYVDIDCPSSNIYYQLFYIIFLYKQDFFITSICLLKVIFCRMKWKLCNFSNLNRSHLRNRMRPFCASIICKLVFPLILLKELNLNVTCLFAPL